MKKNINKNKNKIFFNNWHIFGIDVKLSIVYNINIHIELPMELFQFLIALTNILFIVYKNIGIKLEFKYFNLQVKYRKKKCGNSFR